MAGSDSGGSWTFVPLGAVIVAFQFLAVVALLVAGKWGLSTPEILLTVNPIIGWVDGLSRLAIVPHSYFDSFSQGTSLHQAANVLVYAAIQWVGLGFLLDLWKNSGK